MDDTTKENIAAFIREERKKLDAIEADYRASIGKKASPDFAAKIREEDEAVNLYDRMTSLELMELYQHDPDRWREVLKAKEEAGLRKLFGRR